MRLLRPPWLNHAGDKKDAEVYSCDVSPDGKRLATAAGDSHVRIWSTEAIERAADPSYDGPKQLASMSHHLGTIHAVRFSPNGKYLASGADDKLVCVYNYDPNAPSHATTFGTNEPAPVENWRLFRRLNGHDNDVQDIGWSYDSSILVTVGLDSKVVVWSGYTFERLKTISNHQSHVKGITFDPANKYFATASDDRTIKVFRFTSPKPTEGAHEHLNNFVMERNVTWASQGSPLTTYFRRLSWSPDGNLIAAANSVNGPVSSVAIITRGSWEPGQTAVHLIGHEAPVEVCAFSPRLFSKERFDPAKVAEGQQVSAVTVIACAGQDKTLTLWSTVDSRPMLIAQDLCEKSFSDLAWMPDGQSLFATSLDGTIMYIKFSDGELGYGLPAEQNEQSLAKYGAGRKGAGIVEGPAELRLEERSKEGDMRDVEDRMGAIMGDSASQTSHGLVSTSAPTNGANGLSGSDTGAQANGTSTPAAAPTPEPTKAEKIRSRVTITKDGRKKVAPLLVSSSNLTQSSLPQTALRSAGSHRGTAEEAPQSVIDLSKPVDALPRGGLAAMLLGNKKRMMPVEGDEDGQTEKRLAVASRDGATPILKSTPAGLTLPRPHKSTDPPIVPDYIRPAVVNPSLTTSSVRLAVPKVRDRFVQPYGKRVYNGLNGGRDTLADEGANAGLFMEAQNPTGPSPTGRISDRVPARILVTKNENVKWHDYLPKSVLLLASGESFWAAACEDGSIYCWTLQGRRLLNAMVLESQPVILETNGQWLMCVTSVGLCYVWNMTTLKSPHPPVSLAPVLDIAVQFQADQTRPAPAITSGHVNSEGRIFVTVSNGDGYSYSPNMYTWQRLTEAWWAVISQYWNSRDEAVRELAPNNKEQISRKISEGVLAFLERQTTIEAQARGRSVFLQRLLRALLPMEGYENLEASISIAHLENRIAAALQIGAKNDFHTYLVMYAKRLGAEAQKNKVQELLTDLARGVFDDDVEIVGERNVTGPSWVLNRDLRAPVAEICGVKKEKLLRDCVLVLGKYRELSRIIMPYAKLTGVTSRLGATGAEGDGDDEDAMPVE